MTCLYIRSLISPFGVVYLVVFLKLSSLSNTSTTSWFSRIVVRVTILGLYYLRPLSLDRDSDLLFPSPLSGLGSSSLLLQVPRRVYDTVGTLFRCSDRDHTTFLDLRPWLVTTTTTTTHHGRWLSPSLLSLPFVLSLFCLGIGRKFRGGLQWINVLDCRSVDLINWLLFPKGPVFRKSRFYPLSESFYPC